MMDSSMKCPIPTQLWAMDEGRTSSIIYHPSSIIRMESTYSRQSANCRLWIANCRLFLPVGFAQSLFIRRIPFADRVILSY
ncbi:hypothetical protein KsCSTR_03590 [Candidatus Kuenenia stuttgartiensis]|uniref:Uncharacterized protein n=1 Tax=Kuenenia stuttgartiensis TaxID=174633 RepID=Q1PXV9_KUEST|nr:hypothetical protein KsCSTR_03590 [Candidatus Kuenenia stuttgartiensis]CAJ72875.1 unknown protein [Candidatus Kuenenia stuttgartiensis]